MTEHSDGHEDEIVIEDHVETVETAAAHAPAPPLHPVYNVPINADGSIDLSNGIPIPDEQRKGLHIALAQALASIDAADARGKRQRILDELTGALKVVGFLLPAALAGGLVPAAAVPIVNFAMPLEAQLVKLIEDAQR